jgi:hypothetical protein
MSVCTSGDGNNSPAQGFICPATLAGYRGFCIHDGGAILVRHQGCRAIIQGGPPVVFLAGVLSVCVGCWSSVYAVLACPVLP